MAFPDDPLDLKVQLQLAGTWTDVSQWVSDSDLVAIARGRADEAATSDPATCRLTLENRDGRFAPRNPQSPYYGQLTRNTPLRVLVDEGPRSLDLLGLPTSRARTGDSSALELTGDADWRIDLEPDGVGWPITSLASGTHLVSKWAEAGDQRSWAIFLQNDGRLRLFWSEDGATSRLATSTAPVDRTQRRLALRVVQSGNNGAGGTTIWFYTAPEISGPYTQLGAPVVQSGTTSWFNSSAPVEIGEGTESSKTPGLHGGRVHAFEMRTGLGAGSLVASPDFSVPVEGDTAFADSSGRNWTVAEGARIAPSGVRFAGEVSSWPPRWELAGKDVWAPIEAAGVLRRLQQGATPVDSTLYQAITTVVQDLVAYWPCEDGESAESISGGIPGVAAMQVIGEPEFASNSAMASSHPIPTLNDSQWTGNIPAYTPNSFGQFRVRWIQATPGSTSTGDGQSLMKIVTTGSASIWHVSYRTGGDLRLEAFDSDNNLLYNSGDIGFEINGTNLLISVRMFQDDTDVDTAVVWEIETFAPGADQDSISFGGFVLNETVGRVHQIVVNNGGGIEDIAIGHITFENYEPNAIDPEFDIAEALNAHRGETAGARLQRLCAAYNIPLRIVGDPDDTTRMGYQWPLELVPLLQECEATDGGFLSDDREMLGLTYRTRTSLYNTASALTLDYDAGDLAGALEPTDDDRHLGNDFTVTRDRGGSARAELTEGPLSTAAPPDGVGRYRQDRTLSIYQGSDTPDQATWHLRLGTVDEMRFPAIGVNLRELAADTDLVPDAVAVDAGHRLTITNPPLWLPPEDIAQLVTGYTETLGNWERTVEFACTPASPYNVAEVDSGRYASAGSTLAASATDTATALSVATSAGPLWTTSGSDMPFDVMIGGERMTVTAISGTSSPQTFTVTRSVNGIVKAHSSGATVQLFAPSYRAL